jgi:hypothetical protein
VEQKQKEIPMKVPKKAQDRMSAAVPKFQKVLALAKDRDLNESDSVKRWGRGFCVASTHRGRISKFFP